MFRFRLQHAGRRHATALGMAFFLVAVSVCAAGRAADDENFARWERAIAAFEKADALAPPQKGGVLFVGSSSIRLWKLDESFPEKSYINRGFGGSQIADSVHFADRIILEHEPRLVVVYAGDNDIAAGKSPEQVADDFKSLVKVIHDRLENTKIVFLAIKPSIARWQLVDKMRAANRLIESECGRDKRLIFVDVFTPMLGDDGRPRKELFIKDGLHLNAAGYELWSSILKPHLEPVND